MSVRKLEIRLAKDLNRVLTEEIHCGDFTHKRIRVEAAHAAAKAVKHENNKVTDLNLPFDDIGNCKERLAPLSIFNENQK